MTDEYFKTNGRIPVSEKEGPQPANHSVDQIHAWYQQNFYSAIFIGHGYFGGKANGQKRLGFQ